MYNHSEFGLWGEREAAKFLKDKKLKILATNFETAAGEIDIICLQTKRAAKYQLKLLKKEMNKQVDALAVCDYVHLMEQKQYETKSDLMCFVEVKTRRAQSANIVAPQDAVDYQKQKKYAKVAKTFLSQHNLLVPTRFDIVEVVVGEKLMINHIEGAF